MMVAGTADFTGFKEENPDADLGFVAWPDRRQESTQQTPVWSFSIHGQQYSSPERTGSGNQIRGVAGRRRAQQHRC